LTRPGVNAARICGVSVTVQDFDDALWQTMASSNKAIAVTGIGQQAFKGFPKNDNATVDAAALRLMNLILSRL